MWSVRPSASSSTRRPVFWRCAVGNTESVARHANRPSHPSHLPWPPPDNHDTHFPAARRPRSSVRAHVCARVFRACLPPPALPTTLLSVVLLAIVAAASVPVRSECSVLLVARPWHTRVIRRRRSVINSFRVLSALTCAPIKPTVS